MYLISFHNSSFVQLLQIKTLGIVDPLQTQATFQVYLDLTEGT